MATVFALEGRADGSTVRVEVTQAFSLRGTLAVNGEVVAETKGLWSMSPLAADVTTPTGTAAVRVTFNSSNLRWDIASDLCKATWNGTRVPLQLRRAPLFSTIPRWQRLLVVLAIVVVSIGVESAIPVLGASGLRLMLPLTLYLLVVNIPRNYESS